MKRDNGPGLKLNVTGKLQRTILVHLYQSKFIGSSNAVSVAAIGSAMKIANRSTIATVGNINGTLEKMWSKGLVARIRKKGAKAYSYYLPDARDFETSISTFII